MIETGRRQGAFEIGEIFTQVPLDRERKLLLGGGLLFGERDKRGLRQLRIDHRRRDGLLRIERGETPPEVLQLPNVPLPAIALEPPHPPPLALLHRVTL